MMHKLTDGNGCKLDYITDENARFDVATEQVLRQHDGTVAWGPN